MIIEILSILWTSFTAGISAVISVFLSLLPALKFLSINKLTCIILGLPTCFAAIIWFIRFCIKHSDNQKTK